MRARRGNRGWQSRRFGEQRSSGTRDTRQIVGQYCIGITNTQDDDHTARVLCSIIITVRSTRLTFRCALFRSVVRYENACAMFFSSRVQQEETCRDFVMA
eukprot:scaffold95646_cov21-Prasinocladus_malaysianus.AAC.1